MLQRWFFSEKSVSLISSLTVLRKKKGTIPSLCRSMNSGRWAMTKVSKSISKVWSFFWWNFWRAPTHPLHPIGQKPICGLFQNRPFCRLKCFWIFSECGNAPPTPKRFEHVEVTLWASFGKKNFFRRTFLGKIFDFKNDGYFGGKIGLKCLLGQKIRVFTHRFLWSWSYDDIIPGI